MTPTKNNIKLIIAMQVRLIPSPESGLEEIVIDDQVFSVGRNHKPFRSYPPAIVNRLSRRHARIFEEYGQLFLLDTGSRNGTKLNGKKLADKPVSLSNGDLIGFSDKLVYRVVIEDRNNQDLTRPAASANTRLTLVPKQVELEPIVVTRFPFLVSKTDRVFAKCGPDFAQDIRFISRKHAYFYAKNAEVLVEDLGSTNGTYVNDTRLTEQPMALKDGDTIGFGGKRLVYTVNIEISYPENEAITELLEPTPETRMREVGAQPNTQFIANPNSFLEIFCAVDEEPEAPGQDEINPETENPASSPKPAKTALGRFYRRSMIFLQQAREALSEENPDQRKSWIIVGAVALIVAVGLALYWKGATKRDIETAMEEKNYGRSLELANEYLDEHPEDRDIRKIASESMLKFRVPQWSALIENKQYRKAWALINEAVDEDTAHNEESAKLIAILTWISNLEEFVDKRDGLEAPLVIFNHERAIKALLEWWELDEDGHDKALKLIATSVPEFDPIYSRTFQYFRKLKNERSVYVKAIEQLTATISIKLNTDRATDLVEVFDKFEQKYPHIAGMDRVRSDLTAYLSLNREIERKNLRNIIAFLDEAPLTIPVFQQKVDELTDRRIPSESFRNTYLQSSEAWRNGEADTAINLLDGLTGSRWGDFASSEYERKKKVLEQFLSLEPKLGNGNYATELLEFYSLLDKQEDRFFLAAIASEVQEQTKNIAKEAEKEMQLANKAWQAYVSKGKITGYQRLEPGISQVFRTQATRLAEAYRHAERGMRFYEAARADYAPKRKALYDDIVREARLQYQSLTERKNVLAPRTLEAKLKLLPEPADSVQRGSFEP